MAAPRKTPRGPVDWAEIRRRVEAAGRELAGATAVFPDAAREILEIRARALAQPAAAPAGDTLELVTFALANEVYAIESRYVIAVFKLIDLSPLPGAEPPVCGVTAWRGELLTILDLRAALRLSVTALNDLSRVVVLGEDRPAFGILADAVMGLVTLPASEVRELPEGDAAKREYLRGVTSGAMLVLEAMKLLESRG